MQLLWSPTVQRKVSDLHEQVLWEGLKVLGLLEQTLFLAVLASVLDWLVTINETKLPKLTVLDRRTEEPNSPDLLACQNLRKSRSFLAEAPEG